MLSKKVSDTFFSRQEGIAFVLNRIGAAISQFVEPISSGDKKSASIGSPGQQPFQRFNPKEQSRSQKDGAKDQRQNPESQASIIKLVQNPAQTPEEVPGVPSAPLKLAGAPGSQSVAQAFLLLFEMVREGRRGLTRWTGGRAYQASLRNKGRMKVRKGAMLDQRVE